MSTLKYKGFEGTCEVSVEDGVLHGALVLEGDLVTYESETIAGLEAAFRESVDDYLAFCERIDKSPAKPFKGIFNVRVSPEEHQRANRCAKAQNKTLNRFVRTAIKLHCDRHEVEEVRSYASEILIACTGRIPSPVTRTPPAPRTGSPQVALA